MRGIFKPSAVQRTAATLFIGSCLLVIAACSRKGLSSQEIAAGLAHAVCTAEFVSGRTLSDLNQQEFHESPLPAIVFKLGVTIDHDALSVTAGLPLLGHATAVMRPGLGCVLAAGRPLSQLMKLRADGPAGPAPAANALWPLGERVDTSEPIEGVDRARLEKAIDVAFGQCTQGGDPFTRAIVVVQGGRIVAERYGPGFRAGQRIYAASMSKSVTSTLLGLRIAEGSMALDGVALPAAPGRPDPITNRNLVTMTAGLKWVEEDERIEESDAVRMLLDEPDMAAFAATEPAVTKPGAVFYYSSGSTNILMGSLRKSFHGDEQAYLNYPRKALFDPIGMRSAIFQTDADGGLVGSTFVWASARDWARLGLLYLQDGRWDGRQVLPSSWVDFVRTPAPPTANLPGDERLSYGGGFWLTGASSPTTPAPVYAMVGIWGQTVLIDPARDLVVVRLGYTQKDCPTSDVKPIAALFPATPH